MASISLTDFVLLQTDFELWPGGAGIIDPESDDLETDAPFTYPDGDFLQLSASCERDQDEFVLYLRAILEGETLPFRLRVFLGARFAVEGELDAEIAESTLVWLVYPYLRELVASITGRSPLPPYHLPAVTKLPHPSVLESAVDPPAASP